MAAQELQFTKSSHITAATYDPETQELAVQFNNGGGVYSNVTPDIAEGFAAAPSAGSYLHSVIKANPQQYPYRKA